MIKNDVIILCGSEKNIGKNEAYKMIAVSHNLLEIKDTRSGKYGVPSQVWSCSNIMCDQGGDFFQQEIAKYNNNFNHVNSLNMSTKREHFTQHELHTNGGGKDWITTPSATKSCKSSQLVNHSFLFLLII